jgi:DNA-binding transcriptional ArsR family regulator
VCLVHAHGDDQPGSGGDRGNHPHGGADAPEIGDDTGKQGADGESAVAPEPVDPDRAGTPGRMGAKTALFERFARVGKALGSGKRLELLDLLAQGERTVESLARVAELGLTTASAHLQTLKQANLVTTRRDGTKIYYRLAGDDVAALYALVQAVAGEHLADVAAARATYLGPETDEVTREELLRRVRSGGATVIDVCPREEYAAGHIPRAVST